MQQDWFTADDLASLNLPDLATSKRRVNARAKSEGWRERKAINGDALSRRRSGRGGGIEYHYSVLPAMAVTELARRGIIALMNAAQSRPSVAPQWATYDALPQKAKDEAQSRHKALQRVIALQRSGLTKRTAVETVSSECGVGKSTIFNWFKMVDGRKRGDWLPALAPRHQGRTVKTACPVEALDMLKSDFLRPSRPPFEACFDRLMMVAEQRGWTLPSKKTLQRRIQDIPLPVQVLAREGAEALEQMFPPLDRDRSHFHALEAVNADGHKWDVFVKWEDGSIGRPLMMAVQDLYSNKIVGWRVDRSESADLVRLTFGDVFRDFGVPKHVWLDNGRGFASKWITGGTKTRFRFKVKDEDPAGVLTALGCQVHWTRPYRGQSKPIERGFRMMCDHIAKHPAFEGAYTGNKVDAKPENYGERAVPIADFLKIVARGIGLHNSKTGRRSHVHRGVESYNQAFERSYASAIIPKPTAEQLRMCMLAAEKVSTDRRNGAIRLLGNRYWSEALSALRGQKLVARFDPDNLTQPLAVYSLDGAFLCEAELLEMAGFDSVAAGREHERKRKAFIRAQKDMEETEKRLRPDQVADLLPDFEDDAEAPEPAVIQMITTRSTAKEAAASKLQNAEEVERRLERRLTLIENQT